MTTATSWPLHAAQEKCRDGSNIWRVAKGVEEKECVRLKAKVRRVGNENAEEDGGGKEVKDG